MRDLGFVILAAYVLAEIFQHALRAVNLAHLRKHGAAVPPEFEGELDAALLLRTRDYTIARSHLGFVESIVESAVLIVFIYAGPLDLFNTWMLSLGLPFIVTGILYALLVSLASGALGLPFSIHATFGIENRYGFNTTTWKLWVSDLVKGVAISTLLLAIVGAAALALVQASPGFWWAWVWLFFLLFGIFFMYVSPYLIEPLFNTYGPVREEGLEEKIRELMGRIGIRVDRVQVVDASKRSRHSNAYFTGIGRVKRIVLFDTLLRSHSHEEILAILAHEGGHWKRRHVLKRIVAVEAFSLAGLFIAHRILASDLLIEIFGLSQSSFFAKLILLGFAGSIALLPLTPVAAWLSRRHEREADAFACRLTGGGRDLAAALKKLAKENLSNLFPHPLYAALTYSHPPILDRLRWLRRIPHPG